MHQTLVVSSRIGVKVIYFSHLSSAKSVPRNKNVWLIPEAIPLAINIAGVSCLALGGMAYISSKEPFFFLDKNKRRCGDAVYSKYPVPESKPVSRNEQHVARY
jgi:hypothetical protein